MTILLGDERSSLVEDLANIFAYGLVACWLSKQGLKVVAEKPVKTEQERSKMQNVTLETSAEKKEGCLELETNKGNFFTRLYQVLRFLLVGKLNM